MKIEYHCSVNYSNTELLALLEREKIKHEDVMGKDFVFDVFSDHPKCEEILQYVNQEEKPFIIQTAIFSKKDMEQAEWFTFVATRSLVGTRNNDYTFDFLCEYCNEYGIQKSYHRVQKNHFVVKSVPKWKPKFNFCSEECGDFATIFCSDFAKETLIENQILGVDFLPVLKGDLVTPKENIHQLIFPNVLPEGAIDFVGKHRKEFCPMCGKYNYVFDIPMGDNVRIKKDLIPEGLDVFVAAEKVHQGWGENLIVVSKKVYRLIVEEMNERGVRFVPIG